MKILKLRFKNIHSLKGEQEIDFTISPLSTSGLFAIVGPTGAGKSTILDIITLALFNKIPRFAVKGTESISKTDIETIGSVMTHYTDQAYAEIEYESNQQKYRSTWGISRARTGNLRDYDMTLATLPDGQLMDLKKSEVPAQNEKILGLKYEQFIRSILLSQGDFSRLIRSDEKERAKLLEDITGSHLYREIGKKVYERAKLAEEELTLLKKQKEMILLLTEEEVTHITNEIGKYQTDIIRWNEEINSNTALLQQHEKKQTLQQKDKECQVKQASLNAKKEDFLANSVKLNRHRQLVAQIPNISLWQNELRRMELLQNEKSALTERERHAKLRSEQILANATAFIKSPLTDADFASGLKKFEHRIVDFDRTLNQLLQQGQSLRSRLNQTLGPQDRAIFNEIARIKSADEQFHTVNNRLNEITSTSDKNTISDADLTSRIEQVSQEIVVLNKKWSDAKIVEELRQENNSIQKDVGELDGKIAIINQSLINAEQELAADQPKWMQLLTEKEHILKMVNLDDYRANLKDNEPCPLCGATHHPYSKGHLVSDIGQLELKIQALQDDIHQREKKIQICKTDVSVALASVKEKQHRLQINNAKIKMTSENWDELPAPTVISESITQKQSELADYKKEQIQRTDKIILQQLHEILRELTEVSHQYLSIKQEKTTWYNGSNIHDDINQIEKEYHQAKEQLQSITTTWQNTEKTLQTTHLNIKSLEATILNNIKKWGYSDINAAAAQILNEDQIRQFEKLDEDIKKEETELKHTLENINRERLILKDVTHSDEMIPVLKQKIAEAGNTRDQLLQLSGALQNKLETQKEQATISGNLMKAIRDKEKSAEPLFHLNHLIGDSTGNKYAKYAQNLSLKHLIALANVRLSWLNDRYLLMQTDIEEDLRVIDQYQGNTHRSVKTLSGGETFIISLALALSLADMASKNVKLESLFVDEGFGTLDNETLETALITLEKLQSESNRMIGIISHVESLKDRITTQIRVIKNNLGYSVVEIV